jgi:hypothetical protein
MRTIFQAEKEVEQFEAVLAKYGIQVQSNSILEDAMLQVTDSRDRHLGLTQIDEHWDRRDHHRTVAGRRLISKVLRVERMTELGPLVQHLHLLNTGHPVQSVPHTGRHPLSIDASNKLFELLIGLCRVEAGYTNVDLDDIAE